MYPDGALPSPSPEGYHDYRWCCRGYGRAVARGGRFAVARQSRLHRPNNQDELALQVKATAVPLQISCAFCFACTACHLLLWTHYPILVHSSKSAESFGPNAPHDTTNAISPTGPVLISKCKTIAVLLKASYSLKKSLTGCPLRQQKTICARTWENQLAVATFKKKKGLVQTVQDLQQGWHDTFEHNHHSKSRGIYERAMHHARHHQQPHWLRDCTVPLQWPTCHRVDKLILPLANIQKQFFPRLPRLDFQVTWFATVRLPSHLILTAAPLGSGLSCCIDLTEAVLATKAKKVS